MIKMVTLLKRKPGMSIEEFINYYETKHSKIGEKYVSRHAIHYVRRYLQPVSPLNSSVNREQSYDVVTEIWFQDRAAMDAAFVDFSTAEAQAEIREDEAKLFDCSRIHSFVVKEYESNLKNH